jgi:hypothetical protein
LELVVAPKLKGDPVVLEPAAPVEKLVDSDAPKNEFAGSLLPLFPFSIRVGLSSILSSLSLLGSVVGRGSAGALNENGAGAAGVVTLTPTLVAGGVSNTKGDAVVTIAVAVEEPKLDPFDSATPPVGIAGIAPKEKGVFELSMEGVEVAGTLKENFCSALVDDFAAGVADVATVPLIDGGAPNENKEVLGASTVVADCVAFDAAAVLSEFAGAIFSLLALPAG